MVLSTRATPVMGWNSWNAFRCYDFDEAAVLANADALIEFGLAELGYDTVVIDDGWQAPLRSKSGKLESCAQRFPHGMDWLGKEIHARGLKFGLYLAPGKRTCAQIYDAYGRKLGKARRSNTSDFAELIALKPNLALRLFARLEKVKPVPSDSLRLNNLGSWGREESDFAQLIDWEVDYLKYDWCNGNCGTDLCEVEAFTKMSSLITQAEREITYSISEYGKTQPWTWAPGIANSWRTTADILPTAKSIFGIARKSIGLTKANSAAAFSDPDMLQVGNLRNQELGNTHLRLWGLMNAPLMIGTDLRKYKKTDAVIETLRDSAALYLNQNENITAAEIISENGTFTEFAKDCGSERARLWVNNSRREQKIILQQEFAVNRRGEGRIRHFAVGNKYLVKDFSESFPELTSNREELQSQETREDTKLLTAYRSGEPVQMRVPGYGSVVVIEEKCPVDLTKGQTNRT